MANANEDQFKLYINDSGLFCCIYGFETKLAVLNDTLRGNARGGIYENIISECLIKRGYTLYYFKPDSEHEIEFLIEKNGEVVSVEVKAENTATVSLNNYIKDFSPSIAYKLAGSRNGKVTVKETLPHYMGECKIKYVSSFFLTYTLYFTLSSVASISLRYAMLHCGN